MDIIVVKNENSVIERLWTLITMSANAAIEKNNVFRIGLSGGSLIKYLANGAENATTDWSKWQLYFCDERFVDESNDDSTFGQYKQLFIPKTKLNESQFVVINRSMSLDECAIDYEQQIYDKFGIQKVRISFNIVQMIDTNENYLSLFICSNFGYVFFVFIIILMILFILIKFFVCEYNFCASKANDTAIRSAVARYGTRWSHLFPVSRPSIA